jgi:uncharacterized membrane protein YccF (DUF307 family)
MKPRGLKKALGTRRDPTTRNKTFAALILNVLGSCSAASGWLAHVLAGLLMCITIIGIPFGVQAFKLAGYALWPFGRGLALTGRRLTLSLIGNVLGFIFAAWWLGLVRLFTGIALCFAIIGAVALPEGTNAPTRMIVFAPGDSCIDGRFTRRCAPAASWGELPMRRDVLLS